MLMIIGGIICIIGAIIMIALEQRDVRRLERKLEETTTTNLIILDILKRMNKDKNSQK